MRWVKGFLTFLWEFLIGDTPELFVGACAVILVAWLAHREFASVATYVLPFTVALVMAWSLRRSQKR